MLGQPELNRILGRSDLCQLAQRVTACYHLEPLSWNEIEGYLNHRLAVVGVCFLILLVKQPIPEKVVELQKPVKKIETISLDTVKQK